MNWVRCQNGTDTREAEGEFVSQSRENELKEITIYTDGGAVPNPGRGGYGAVLRFGRHVKELNGGFELTTNNRMELMAVIVALEALKQRCRVKLHCDSKYVVDAIQKGSAVKWRSNGWAMNLTKTKLARNADLWERLLSACEVHDVEMIWVKGHAGIEGNERCDQLAMEALQKDSLPPDEGYQQQPKTGSPPGDAGTQSGQSRTKMIEIGQPCRKCQTAVIKRLPRKKTVKPNQIYYYAWYLYCPGCNAMYMVEDAKREITGDSGRLFESQQ